MKVAIYSRAGNPEQENKVFDLIRRILPHVEVVVYAPFYQQVGVQQLALGGHQLFTTGRDLDGEVACLMSVGGDGTFIDAAHLVYGTSTPIVGVSTGRLGFLAYITMEQFDDALQNILQGRFLIEPRTLIQVEGCPDGDHIALNEVCLQKNAAAIAEIHAYINGQYITTYWADGLIIATPTGSTAYSLSAGGPILAPEVQALVLAPIAAHNLSVRPVIVPDNALLEVEMVTRTGSIIVGIDSAAYELPSTIRLKVRKADRIVNFLKFENASFYQTLRDKLLWGVDTRS